MKEKLKKGYGKRELARAKESSWEIRSFKQLKVIFGGISLPLGRSESLEWYLRFLMIWGQSGIQGSSWSGVKDSLSLYLCAKFWTYWTVGLSAECSKVYWFISFILLPVGNFSTFFEPHFKCLLLWVSLHSALELKYALFYSPHFISIATPHIAVFMHMSMSFTTWLTT